MHCELRTFWVADSVEWVEPESKNLITTTLPYFYSGSCIPLEYDLENFRPLIWIIKILIAKCVQERSSLFSCEKHLFYKLEMTTSPYIHKGSGIPLVDDYENFRQKYEI